MKTSNLSNYGIAMNPSLPRGKPSGPVALASLLMVSLVCAGQTPSVTTRSAAASANEFQRGDSLEIRDGQLVWNAPGKSDTNRNSVATLKNVVDLLREQHPEANFILSPGLDRVSIADLKLRNADVKEKLQAICIASGSIVGWRDENQSPGGRIDPVTGVALPEERRASQPMFVFYDTGALSARPALQVEAFNISAYLESVMAGVADPDERSERANRAIAEIHQMAVETVDRY